MLMAEGERAKTLNTVAAIYDQCVKRGLDRSATIVAFGGGVVGDVAGFAVEEIEVARRVLAAVETTSTYRTLRLR